MKFLSKILDLGIGQHLSLERGPTFDSISGYKDIKQLICRALHSGDSINILFWGEPASSKTMFLMELAREKGAVYFDCTNTTNKILQVLDEERPRIILLDEVDKMPRQFQQKLLNFLEWTGESRPKKLTTGFHH